MTAIEKIYQYMEVTPIEKGKISWWTKKGNVDISIKDLYKVREDIRRKIEELNSASVFKFLFECNSARRYGSDVQIENFYDMIRIRNEPHQDLEKLHWKIETYMGRFIKSLIRKYDIPGSIHIILRVVNEGGDYYSPLQKIEFKILEEID